MSDEPEVQRFSLKRKEIKVLLEDLQGLEAEYTVREFSGTDRDKFLNLAAGKMKVGPDGKPQGMRDFTGMFADLLAMTVYGPDGKLVPIKTIQEWPTSTQQSLFKMAQEINSLGQKAQEEAKND